MCGVYFRAKGSCLLLRESRIYLLISCVDCMHVDVTDSSVSIVSSLFENKSLTTVTCAESGTKFGRLPRLCNLLLSCAVF